MKDERIIQVRNKILGEMAILMYIFVVAAFVVKTIFMEKKIVDCVVEYVILLFFPIYQYVRTRQLKISLYQPESLGKKERRRRSVVSAAVAAAVFAVCFWRTSPDIKEVLPSLVAFIISFQLAKMLITKIEKNRTKRLEKEYEDGEE